MHRLLDRPRLLGLFCAASAVGLGLAFMSAAGAPPRHLLVNLAALILGASAWLGLGPWANSRLARGGWAVLALALPLLATALFAAEVDGASRWLTVGPLSVQVSLIVVPTMIMLYARNADAIGTIGIAIAALALAAQPDRAMAGVLAASVGAVLLTARSRLPALALAAAAAGFGATMLLPDALPAVPFVDGILYTAFDVHAAAGLAVVAGCFILLAPALVGALRTTHDRPAMAAFGTCWAMVVAAAAIGNYPTPLVGYGGSAVLGYLLSVALLPSQIRGDSKAKSGDGRLQVAPTSAP
jgi:cell division protein FtsW (lipid II flippase)